MVRSFHARLRNLVFLLGGKEIDSTFNLAQGEESRVHHKLQTDHPDTDLGQGSAESLLKDGFGGLGRALASTCSPKKPIMLEQLISFSDRSTIGNLVGTSVKCFPQIPLWRKWTIMDGWLVNLH